MMVGWWWSAAMWAGWCATIGIGIESNRINGADSFLGLLTDYAGIANRSLFDVGLFDLVGERGIVRAECVSTIP
jgi:hypothetical protein